MAAVLSAGTLFFGFAAGAPVAFARPAPSPTPLPALVTDAPAGVRIEVRMDQRLSSQDARTGDVFSFETTRDFTVGAHDVKKGARGYGVVELALSRGKNRSGQLDLSARAIDLGNGAALAVALPRDENDKTPVYGTVVQLYGNTDDDNVVIDKGYSFAVITTVPETPEPRPAAT